MNAPILARLCAALALLLAAPALAQAAAGPDRYAPVSLEGVKHPSWSRDAVIYQLNTRQFTPEGTFSAAQGQLPRLKALGVDIIWLMPIHPIGQTNRKGTLGSPYSVRDFRAVNPEFGTVSDLKAFVDAAHAQGMHVILDWVANHSSWDNALVTEHPDWYERDWKGDFRPTPWWDWSDIIDFDYSKTELRRYMAQSMAYWVRDVGVDGFRADVAGYVPIDFWETVRADLDAIKPVFMLGEWEMRDLHMRAFDATYAWEWNKAMAAIGAGKADVGALFGYYSGNESAWPSGAMRMTYVSNHDQNAWEGTEFERFGPALTNTMVLSMVGEGIPVIYNGQEAGNQKRLEFFEKDPIQWREHPNGALYKRLIAFRKAHPALANAPWGARMVRVVNSAPTKVFSFVRRKDGDKVLVVMNFSAEPQRVTFPETLANGAYRDFAGGKAVTVAAGTAMDLPPWSYRLLASR
jgi:glycosidase